MSFTKRIVDVASKLTQKSTQVAPEFLPKQYAHVVSRLQQEQQGRTEQVYGDYLNSSVKFNYQDDYEFESKLGRGRYSEVFKAVNILDNQPVVVKILKPGKSFPTDLIQ